jgi:predicted nucleic acid-binding protein
MAYLIDTNVICETIKSTPNANVVKWFNSIANEDLYISVLTLGEIRKGLEKINDLDKKRKICLWLEQDLVSWFGERILSINLDVANKWGILCTETIKSTPVIDSLIASTALQFDLILVTRNTKDFCYQGLELINPFEIHSTT